MSGHDCPTCGRTLATERGMRQHHTKVHNDPLPNRTCAGCGTQFYDPKARLSYCEDCDPEAGEHNGNWRGATEEATCRLCGDPFEYYPSNKEGVFCPTCVEDADEFLGTPSWEGNVADMVVTPCQYCGDDVEMRESKRVHGSGRFCSNACRYAWMSENWRGSDHPNWKGGWDDDRNRNWNSARRAALERDDHECQNCGTTRDDLDREPDVHHIVPIRAFDDPTDAHALDNLITLCRRCHMKVEHDLIPLPDDRDEKLNI